MASDTQDDADPAERLHTPETRTWSFYVVALLVVFPVWSLTPLSWMFVLYTVVSGNLLHASWSSKTWFFIAICEVLFSIYYYYLSASIIGRPPLSHGNIQLQLIAFKRILRAGLACLPEHLEVDEETLDSERPGSPEEDIVQLAADDPRAIDFRTSFRNWFGKAPFSSIRVHHVRTWLYAFVFSKALPPLDKCPAGHRAIISHAMSLLEKRAGQKITPGQDDSITPICLAIDKVNVRHRPLIFYLAIRMFNWFSRAWFTSQWDVQFARFGDMEYCIRIPEGWDAISGPRPIVFVHGLGLGLFQYHIFISHLLQAIHDRPILVLIQPHLSQDVFHPRYLKPMASWDTTKALSALLVQLGWAEEIKDERSMEREEWAVKRHLISTPQKGVTMLSHSNGSYTHAWMLKQHPEMVTRSCFVDPVTFCSWEGDVCYNFLYRPCTTAFDLLMHYYVGTELGVVNLLRRNFDWAANALWYEDIPNARDPRKTAFVVGGKDSIVNAQRVKRYLYSHGVRKGLWYDPEGRHGQPLIIGGRGHVEIIRWLREPESTIITKG